jgi:hypothetical protein
VAGQTPVNILVVGVAHRGVAFPVSWTVLRRFFAVVDPSEVGVLLADREFISAEWLHWLQAREVPFAVRLRSDRRIGLASQESLRDGPSLPTRMFARPLQVGDE